MIAATQKGMRCRCLSLVTNRAAGLATTPLTHEEVLEAGRHAANQFQALLARSEITAE